MNQAPDQNDSNGNAPFSASGRLVAQDRAGDNAPPLSVSEISGALRRAVEERFGHVRVRGEISGFKRAASGHVYMSLKDDKAVIDAVMWKGAAARLAFAAEDGIEVIATGRLTTYPGRSKYQIVIDALELAGEGALMALFEKLKAKLAAEGLFAAERKQSLPFLPRTIGVITSPTGAVIRDILHRLEDRCPTRVIVWPVPVQGEGASARIAAAIRGFGLLESSGIVPRPDLLIVARGGGSIEDLWAFNEEVVVRAVAACRIPTISAVGHETDTSLADYAADARAPTPTAAAEMAVPVRAEWLGTIRELGLRAQRGLVRQLERSGERLRALARVIPSLDRLIAPQRQRLDEQGERLTRALAQRLMLARQTFARIEDRLTPVLLQRLLRRDRDRLASGARILASLNPRAILSRGYAMVTDAAGKVVGSAARAKEAGALTLQFGDGSIAASTSGTDVPTHPAKAPRTPRASKPSAKRQDDLFE